jgi:Ulp1 family protease
MEKAKHRYSSGIPRQENFIDCGVFMLKFSEQIIRQNNLNATMGITQANIWQCRLDIYHELVAHRQYEIFYFLQIYLK